MDEKTKALANEIMETFQKEGLTCKEVGRVLALIDLRVGEQKSNAADAAAFIAKPL